MGKSKLAANAVDGKPLAKGHKKQPNLNEIEEAETGLWLHEQLSRIRAVLVELDSDEEMLDAIDYLIEENEQWIDPDIANAVHSGIIRSGEA